MATVTHKTSEDVGSTSGKLVTYSSNNTIKADTIAESSTGVGVTIDGITLKDGSLAPTNALAVEYGGTGAITTSGAATSLGVQSYSGFVNRTSSIIEMVGGAFQIRPASTTYTIYSDAVKYVKNSLESIDITNSGELVFIFFNSSGVLQASTTAWDTLSNDIPIATVFIDGANYALCDERHNYLRNRLFHKWAHETIGTRYHSGFTGTFTNNTLSITQGKISDEDIEFDSVATKTSNLIWHRGTGGTGMKIYGVSNTPYIATSNVLQYDNNGTLAGVSTGRYICCWIYAAPDTINPIYSILSQAQYTNITNARAATAPIINLTSSEWKLLYRVIYRQETSNTILYTEKTDYRTTTTGPAIAATFTDHSALIGRDVANSHPKDAITGLTDTDVATFAGVKLPSSPGSSDNNTFDCYLQGTWTPELRGSTSNPTVSAYQTQTGTYTRWGNVCNFIAFIYILSGNVSGGSGTIHINLPFTPSIGMPLSVSHHGILYSADVQLVPVAQTDGMIWFNTIGGQGQGEQSLSVSAWPTTANAYVKIGGTYLVA